MYRESAIEVGLPGGFWSEEGTLIDRVPIRPLSGTDEEWLASRPAELSSGAVAAELLRRCVVEHDADRLLIGDRDYLLLQLRQMTVGHRFGLVVTCPGCARPMDVAFDAGDVPVERRLQRKRRLSVSVEDAAGARHKVAYHLPTVGDLTAALGAAKPESALLSACVETIDGRHQSSSELDATLDGTARERLDDEMESRAPAVEVAMRLQCPDCAAEFDFDVDMVPFLLEELHSMARQVWPEVHHLALHYHWSEGDILGLPRERRRRYIGLINDSLRGAAGS